MRKEYEEISNLGRKRDIEVRFDPDAGAAQLLIEEDAKKYPDKRILLLGSAWEKGLASRLHADLLIVTVPVKYRLIMNCGYTGYDGGLRTIEDIFDRVLATYR